MLSSTIHAAPFATAATVYMKAHKQGLAREQEVNGVSCRDDLEGELTASQKPHPATKAAVSAQRIFWSQLALLCPASPSRKPVSRGKRPFSWRSQSVTIQAQILRQSTYRGSEDENKQATPSVCC
ncbi:uncharacterized protein LOC143164076 [Aptenodytes patagonicus]|uniref:uncharacterized protein LOC143164076 n=1 Tax=Aptenodytes patagonicus TaxID=9234 RepID=UPI003FA0B54E